jgi:hypothetical protein
MLRTLNLPDSEMHLLPVERSDLVRLGRPNDGGYVVPVRAIDAADRVLSLGLFDDWSFEAELLSRKAGLAVHGYDHTIGALTFKRAYQHELLRFVAGRSSLAEVRRRRATCRDFNSFFSGPNRHFREKITNNPEAGSECDLTTALDRLGGSHVLVKVDIEGSEYRIIDQLAANAHRICALCIEFHDTDPLREIFDRSIERLISPFAIVHVHPNNYGKVALDGLPDVLEVSFLNRRLTTPAKTRGRVHLPALDQPNNPALPDLAIMGCSSATGEI